PQAGSPTDDRSSAFDLFERVDRRLFARPTDPLAKVALPSRVAAPTGDDGRSGTDIVESELDVVVDPSPGPMPDRRAMRARFGLWRLLCDGEPIGTASAAVFRARGAGQTTCETTLVASVGDPATCYVLDRSRSRLHHLSVHRS